MHLIVQPCYSNKYILCRQDFSLGAEKIASIQIPDGTFIL